MKTALENLLNRAPALFFGAVLLACAGLARATDYYVDCNKGSNGNSGSFDSPWRTPLAVGKHASTAGAGFFAGDGIYLKRGCVWRSSIKLGAPSNWVASTSYASLAYVLPRTLNGHWYKNLSGACTSAGSQPTFPTNGTAVADNSCVWQDMGTNIPNSGTNGGGGYIHIDSYGGWNSVPYSAGGSANFAPGSGPPPRFTGELMVDNSSCRKVGGGGTAACWCEGTWTSPGGVPTCTPGTANIWSTRPLFDDNGSGSDNCPSDGGNCVPCPSGGFFFSCYDQPLEVMNFVRFGTVFGNNQEIAVDGATAIDVALAQDRDWYFDPAITTGGGHSVQTLWVYCTCSGATTPDTYYGNVAPIGISNEQSPANGGAVMLSFTGVQYVAVAHLLFDWYDGIGMFLQGNTSGSVQVPVSDRITIANVVAASYIPNANYRYVATGDLCGSPTACATLGPGTVQQYTQIGLWVNNNWSGSSTPYGSISVFASDFHMNNVGIQVESGNRYPCNGCTVSIFNSRFYANRTYGIQDNLGGAAILTYSHLYSNNLATALETDVQSNFNLPAAGMTCSNGFVTAVFPPTNLPMLTLNAGATITVNTGGASVLTPATFAGTFPLTTNTGNNNDTLTWDMGVECPAASATGGSLTAAAVRDGGNNLDYVNGNHTIGDPVPHSVALTWVDPDPVTFNVYRGESSGGPYAQIASGLPTPEYEDTTVLCGGRYYYVVTAVDAFDQESDFSSEVLAIIPTCPGRVNYAHVVPPHIQNGQRFPAYVTMTYDDPGLVLYSDNYVAQALALAISKFGASNFSIATVTGGEFSGLNVNGSNANPGFVAEVQGWIDSGFDVLTHSTSHTYWSPPAPSCGTGTIPCQIFDNLRYLGSVASTVNLTISHDGPTCAGLGVSSSACFVITTSPSDPAAEMALDITSLWPYSAGASTSQATLGQLVTKLNTAPFATAGCSITNLVCFDAHAGNASQALSHSLDDTYSSSGVLGAVNLAGAGVDLYFKDPLDTAVEPPYFETDEMSWADTWMDHYLTGLPSNRVYVMPGTYADSASEAAAAAAGYAGVRGTGALKPCCTASTLLTSGYDVYNILSQGVVPNFQGLTYAQMRALMTLDSFRNGLWGRPIGWFWHINELPYDQVQNWFDAIKQSGATVLSNTDLTDMLLGASRAPLANCEQNSLVPPIGVGDKGSTYVSGSFYVCAGYRNDVDWRPTVNSPTWNAGQNLSVSAWYDLWGVRRPDSGAWDIGAFQHVPMGQGTPQHP